MANINAYTIKRNIYKSSKYTLLLYIPPSETIEHNNAYEVNIFPTLYLSMPYDRNVTVDEQKTRSFKIKPTNLKNLLRTLSGAMEWFFDSKYKDMYLINDQGTLVFNSDYKGLYQITKKGYFDNDVIKIIPSIIETAYQKYEEGVIIFVNRLENQIHLSLSEFEILYDILDQFDFTQATILCYEALRHSILSGKMVGEAEYQQRLQNTGYYNR